nr:hypothetical protein [Tanacetum cinerariifolium]
YEVTPPDSIPLRHTFLGCYKLDDDDEEEDVLGVASLDSRYGKPKY